MTNPPWQRLTRDRLVAIIGDYYKFLTKFYIPESALKFPPPEGWPSITPETTKGFPKSPIVIDLLKHLPYIDEKEAGNMVTNIHYKSDVVDYSTWEPQHWSEDDQYGALSVQMWIEELEEAKKEDPGEVDDNDEGYLWYQDESREFSADEEENWWDGDDPEDIKLEHMIVLANGYESGGRTIILDVFKANIYEDMVRCDLQSEVAVEHFFDNMKVKFENLEYVPVPGYGRCEGEMYEDEFQADVSNKTLAEENPAQQYKKIYRSFGWPGETYRKEEALAAIQAHREHRDGKDHDTV